MPGASGREVLAHAARVAPAARRVLITGYLELEDAKGALEPGVMLLRKPFQPAELLRVLQQP